MKKIPFDYHQLARLGGLFLRAGQTVEGFLAGIHRSPYKGFSVEFAEHRPYYPGDEIRHVDWRTFGKTDRFYVKEFEDETNLRALLLLDASGSMAYQSSACPVSKWQQAQGLAAALAYLLLRQADAVGLIIHDQQILQQIPCKVSVAQLGAVISALENARPQGEGNLAPCWTQSLLALKKRGLFLIISDCFAACDTLKRSLGQIRQKGHATLLFQVLHPDELTFPFAGTVLFENLEQKLKLTSDAWQLKKNYLARFHEHQTALQKICSDLGVHYHLLTTEQSWEVALARFIHVYNGLRR